MTQENLKHAYDPEAQDGFVRRSLANWGLHEDAVRCSSVEEVEELGQKWIIINGSATFLVSDCIDLEATRSLKTGDSLLMLRGREFMRNEASRLVLPVAAVFSGDKKIYENPNFNAHTYLKSLTSLGES